MRQTVCTGLLLLLAACAAAPAPPAAAPAAPARLADPSRPAPPDGFEVRLRRSGCYGRCPVYAVVLHGDGTVDYSGGVSQHGQADPAAFAALRRHLADPALPWGDYTRAAPAACGAWSTDMPGVTIEAYFGGRWHTVRHDLGCAAAPAALKALEQEIDDAAGTQNWSGGRAVE